MRIICCMNKKFNRVRAGTFVNAAGILLNLLLAAAKITVGALFGLVSVMADGFNNISDCGSSVVSMVSIRIADKPADKEHPYGHRRAEYVASMIIGFIVVVLAVELFGESLSKIIDGVLTTGDIWVYLVLGISVGVKAVMFVFYRIAAKKLNSDTLRAASIDSACDCLATLAVIAGVLISNYTGFPADGWAGLAVALFILWQGGGIVFAASSKLLGQAPDPKLIEGVKSRILGGQWVLGLHDLRVYSYGRDTYFATAHIEMDASLPALEAHAVLDAIELEVLNDLGVNLTAHLDPVDLKDTEARELEDRVRARLSGLAEGLEVHDFRLIRGAKMKIVFDIGVPYSCPQKDGELKAEAVKQIAKLGEYESVITIDRE